MTTVDGWHRTPEEKLARIERILAEVLPRRGDYVPARMALYDIKGVLEDDMEQDDLELGA